MDFPSLCCFFGKHTQLRGKLVGHARGKEGKLREDFSDHKHIKIKSFFHFAV